MRFVSLHHHSTFSYLDGYGLPETHCARAAELGMNALALTEHGNVTSHVRLEQAAQAQGIKPIFGCELYTGGVGDKQTQRKNHLTVLAESAQGYRNLLSVVSRGWEDGFYYEPTVSGPMLAERSEGLVVLSGCSGSLVATSLIGGKNIDAKDASLSRARRTVKRFYDALGDAFYLEVQAFPELERTRNINQGIAELSSELGIPLVATLDAHYTRPDEAEMQQILHNVRAGNKRTMEDLERSWGYEVPLTFGLTDKHIYERLRSTGLSKRDAEQAILNTEVIAQRCNVTLPKVENLRYPLGGSGETDPTHLFRRWLNEGWKYRRFPSLLPQERQWYVDRVKYEASLIEGQGFVDYFLVVADIVKWAKDHGIPVGPARGSAAASLVCYLLRITEVNPMLFPTLLFERFIDANRHDLPDIDLDFDDELRYLVRDYAVSKYGADRVGNIGTFVRYKGKNSLDDVQRSLYPKDWDAKAAVETVKDLLIERSSGDLRASATIEDSIEMFPQVKQVFDKYPGLYKAIDLEGNVKGMSVHAAGLVLANGPLQDFCAIYTREHDDGTVTQVVSLDKYDAEYLNVLKLDALGLKTMASIRIALEIMDMTLEELYAVPLDDEATINGFREGDVVGVFQFDGRAMRSVNAGVLPDNFMEVADVNALARPGPLHSGATAEYIDVKHGRKPALHYHAIVDDITRHTNYQVVYQEQILQVVRLLGEFSWEEAARIRKIISKKRGEQEFNRQRDKFVEGAATHGMDARDAHRVFNLLATAGAYAFNAAHCVSYGLLAYWTMWIKRNDPLAFYVGSLRKYADKEAQLLRDVAKKHIDVLPLCINNSEYSWSASNGALRPGFTQVKGIGDKTAQALLELREERGEFQVWEEAIDVRGVGPVTLDLLCDFSDAEDAFGLHLLTDTLDAMRSRLQEGIPHYEGSPFLLPMPTHTADDIPYERTEVDVGVVWLGVFRERNLKDLFEVHHSKTGEVLDPRKVKRPELNEWVVVLGEDDTGLVSLTFNRWTYPKLKAKLWEVNLNEDLVLIRGIKVKEHSHKRVSVSELWIMKGDYIAAAV
jgi:DNA polymerase III subunit alpha